MIYLLTGTPGAGKTLYAVSTFINKLMKDIVTPDGKPVKRRLLVDGIPGLAIDHQPLTAPDIGIDGSTVPPKTGGDGVWNWYEWCQPGDLIVIDEVQRHWRPRGLGTKPPLAISSLETHRHKGVDFILITQSASLLDQNVRRLIERHTHVRRAFGGGRSILYDWDGCQVNTSSTKQAQVSYWGYPKDAYKLYTSSSLHVKPVHRFPIWALLPIIALAGFFFFAPKAYTTLTNTMTGKGFTAKPSDSASAPTARPPAAGVAAAAGSAPALPPLQVSKSQSEIDNTNLIVSHETNQNAISGCVKTLKRCTCYSESGFIAPVSEAACQSAITVAGGLISINANNPSRNVSDLVSKNVSDSVSKIVSN